MHCHFGIAKLQQRHCAATKGIGEKAGRPQLGLPGLLLLRSSPEHACKLATHTGPWPSSDPPSPRIHICHFI